jgi:peptidoglycan/xylan/chitin deacetylase (PgdA/CDA1 family)
MIGVVANEAEHRVVVEFFELFKTPWEFHRPGTHYDILICSNSMVPENSARLLFLYGTQRQAFEECRSIRTISASRHDFVSFRGERMPIYGSCLLFNSPGNEVLIHERTKSAAAVSVASGDQMVVRVGFDLFEEVRYLLTQGQPAEFASIPTLDLHLSLLCELIVSCGVPLVEILPTPAEHHFIVCLTHDIDHPRVRNHKCDHTMFGFLYRAMAGSIINFCRGRRSLRQVALNWKAALSLPLVFAGLAKDFWNQLDRYLELESDLASTFFVIPTKGDAGVDSHGRTRTKRASRYALADIADDLNKLLSTNCEIAVHGIDAWRDSAKGREERRRIQEITGTADIGVRMHWLYFNSQASLSLEKAGFSYDSTVGYNETIGYRAGTAQVFKNPDVDHLLELPLHIMDTALFYPSYMNLSDEQAGAAILPLIENATRFGGVLTINWHDRSLGPERLWADFYLGLIDELKSRGAWFPTASEAISWFRKRRSAVIEGVIHEGDSVRMKISVDEDEGNLPGLRVRVHKARSTNDRIRPRREYAEVTVNRSSEINVSLS